MSFRELMKLYECCSKDRCSDNENKCSYIYENMNIKVEKTLLMLQKCKLKQVCGMYYYLFIKLLNNEKL